MNYKRSLSDAKNFFNKQKRIVVKSFAKEMTALKVDEKSFRELYRQICLLTDKSLVDAVKLRDAFDYPPDEKLDGFLTYACIDDGTFVFEILAGAKVSGGRIKIFPGSYKKSVQIRRAEFEDADINILSDDFKNAFQDKIRIIEDENKVDADKNFPNPSQIIFP